MSGNEISTVSIGALVPVRNVEENKPLHRRR